MNVVLVVSPFISCKIPSQQDCYWLEFKNVRDAVMNAIGAK